MTWKQLTERDRREWKLSAIHPHVRDTWRSGASFTKKDRTISLKMSVRSFLRSAYVGFIKTS